jgi:hypothetical protein
MGNDLLRGNRLELPWFAGKVVELGRHHGIPTLRARARPRVAGREVSPAARDACLPGFWAPAHRYAP